MDLTSLVPFTTGPPPSGLLAPMDTDPDEPAARSASSGTKRARQHGRQNERRESDGPQPREDGKPSKRRKKRSSKKTSRAPGAPVAPAASSSSVSPAAASKASQKALDLFKQPKPVLITLYSEVGVHGKCGDTSWLKNLSRKQLANVLFDLVPGRVRSAAVLRRHQQAYEEERESVLEAVQHCGAVLMVYQRKCSCVAYQAVRATAHTHGASVFCFEPVGPAHVRVDESRTDEHVNKWNHFRQVSIATQPNFVPLTNASYQWKYTEDKSWEKVELNFNRTKLIKKDKIANVQEKLLLSRSVQRYWLQKRLSKHLTDMVQRYVGTEGFQQLMDVKLQSCFNRLFNCGSTDLSSATEPDLKDDRVYPSFVF